ncbi:MAG: ribonuclease P protein component [Anaerolineales bacterium]|nr:ribonuclease P protein component [Anaerolineales bacterium]
MQRRFRLTRSSDFKRVRCYGKSYAHPFIVLMTQSSGLPGVRVGIAAGRSVGNAVRRNRAKRLMRAAMAPLLPVVKPGWNLVLIARQSLLEKKTPEISAALTELLERAQLIAPFHGP